ncbi:MAG: DUF1207 domain-containing protein [Ignavibacteria bacterium]|nr:DUF1207 domain-containing protein [Ignavibacteria bacterium]MCU7501808.1 DUF1207 domain-containing protein [Ignavibacteria bacterium]MCU7518271.1 DUF1207 domain-containing protein [Ignavibacteria bacterium]
MLRYIFLFFLFPALLFSQSDSTSVSYEFAPSGLHFAPLKANYQEARIGLLYYPSDANLKVDVGNTIDLLKIGFPASRAALTFGLEFMAYAYSTSYSGYRLQIDALDGFFGGNAAFSKDFSGGRFISRFRIIHNSAHLVDGHYDVVRKEWIGSKTPIPFTRDFGELLAGYEWLNESYSLRVLGGPTYATLVRPLDIKKYSFSSGFEYAYYNPFGQVFRKDFNLFLAYYINIMGSPVYHGNNNLVAGLKFGQWYGKGVLLYLNYYAGSNMFSEYYKDNIHKFGIGFSVDFP